MRRFGQPGSLRWTRARLGVVLLGLVGVLWGAWALTREREVGPIVRIAGDILTNQSFDDAIIERVLSYLDRTADRRRCLTGLRPAAVIRVYAAVAATNSGHPGAADRLRQARDALRAALACAPHDGYLWYNLYWIERTAGAAPAAYLSYLRMSYALAPREGWIGYFRSPDAVIHLNEADAALRAAIGAEYLRMAQEYPDVAVAALRDADTGGRAALLELLTALPLKEREKFARRVDEWNLEVDIPGVAYENPHRPKNE